ncbi:hypothetical protein HanIR_Chr10g0497611 [Helianthus annuus]|nr:hypothetical protein HanIR_Chr10g0497611 [Helianthus annuus]
MIQEHQTAIARMGCDDSEISGGHRFPTKLFLLSLCEHSSGELLDSLLLSITFNFSL